MYINGQFSIAILKCQRVILFTEDMASAGVRRERPALGLVPIHLVPLVPQSLQEDVLYLKICSTSESAGCLVRLQWFMSSGADPELTLIPIVG